MTYDFLNKLKLNIEMMEIFTFTNLALVLGSRDT